MVYDIWVSNKTMDYNRDDYLTDNDDDEYLTSILVDINSRYFVMFSNLGDERKVECETVDEFMNVLELVRAVVDEDQVYYVDPLVKTPN